MWTSFWDMHSGGSQKEKFTKCFIEASEDEAMSVFYSRFGHNPERVTCTCCGGDYSIEEGESLEQMTAYHRNCEWYESPKGKKEGRYFEDKETIPKGWKRKWFSAEKEYVPLGAYIKSDDVMVIHAKDIKDKERKEDVPVEGYTWQ